MKELLRWGDHDLKEAFKGLKPAGWKKVGVTTRWSAKDLMAHLVSYEWLLADAFKYVLKIKPTPTLDTMNEDYEKFNDAEVLARKAKPPAGKSVEALRHEEAKTIFTVSSRASTKRRGRSSSSRTTPKP